jgi:hypothetical protein
VGFALRDTVSWATTEKLRPISTLAPLEPLMVRVGAYVPALRPVFADIVRTADWFTLRLLGRPDTVKSLPSDREELRLVICAVPVFMMVTVRDGADV